MSVNEVSVFFYGLFMDEARLAASGIYPSRSVIGYVEGHALRLGRRATLIHEPGSTAYGVLMILTAAELDALYSDESVADYRAEPVTVTLADGGTETALCYNLPRVERIPPEPAYAKALLTLARKLGFPDRYLRQIEEFARK